MSHIAASKLATPPPPPSLQTSHHLSECPGHQDGILPGIRVKVGVEVKQTESCLQTSRLKLCKVPRPGEHVIVGACPDVAIFIENILLPVSIVAHEYPVICVCVFMCVCVCVCVYWNGCVAMGCQGNTIN